MPSIVEINQELSTIFILFMATNKLSKPITS